MGLINWALNLGNTTLYFPGCFTKYERKDVEKNYEEIFNLLGIRFRKLLEINCCGSTPYNAGYKREAKKIIKKNYDDLSKNGIKKIITNSPEAFYFFKEIYPTIIRDWNIEVEHASVTILKALNEENIFSQEETKEIVTYHDPFYLGRYSNIYEEPRNVLKILGGEIVEFKKTRDKTPDVCSETSFYLNYPEVAKESAKSRLKDAPKEATRIISTCALTTYLLKQSDSRSIEFSTFVLEKLRGVLK